MVLKTVSTLGGGGGGGGGGNVSGVSASLPVISSGGTTPNISFISPGIAGNVLTSIGGVWVSNAAVSGGGNGTPGGANTTIQFNNSGAFGGSANLTWDGANVQIGSSGLFKLSNGVTNYVSFRAPNVISSNVTWTLPNTDGTDGQVLITNGAGTLFWATPTLTPTAPTNDTLPIVTGPSGTPTVGQTFNSTTGTWSGYPAPSFEYQWIRGAATNVGTNSPSYQLVDADLGSTVKCRVTATNTAGSANATSAATANIVAGAPQAPTGVTAVAENAQATISFTAPAITGGSPIVYYAVTCVENGFINSGPSSPVTITGLTNGVSYTFIVTATNGFGTGPAGGPSSPVTPTAAPVTDTSFPYVPLLLNTGTTNGQNNQGTTTTNGFLDSSSNTFTITRSGTPTQGSITPYWPAGQWSNFFSSSYLSVADSASLRFGAANFTIEAWVYRTASGTTHTIAAKGASTPTGWVLQVSSADKLVFIDTALSITGATSIPANTWTYVAVVRAGTSLNQTTLYVNGASDGTGTSATTFSQTDAMRIGTDRSAANGFAGYISNLRLSNTNLTISSTPTTPLTASGSTIFLSCGYNRFVDGSSLTSAITVGSGTPTVQAFQPFSPSAAYTPALYGGSGYFNGSSQLSIPNNAAFELGAENFSYEAFVYATVATNTFGQGIISYGIAGNSSSSICSLNISDTGFLQLVYPLGAAALTDPASFPVNQWVHCVACRSGLTLSLFVNGVRKATTATSATVGTGGAMVIGGQWFANASTRQLQNGYISNVRVLKGASAYDATLSTLTVPTAPVTEITNTSLLLNFTNAGIYDATTQNVITTVGSAQVSDGVTPQFLPTSMRFTGTSDWLTVLDSPQLRIGTGNFTIEGWFYLSTAGSAYGIVSKGAASTGWSVNVTSGNRIQFSYAASNLTGATTTLASGAWYYFAVVRSGIGAGNLKIYLNNSLEVSSGVSVQDNFDQTNILYVGASRTGTTPLNGYLEEIRITKAARIITAQPSAPFPVQ
jgi:hypothetical protein